MVGLPTDAGGGTTEATEGARFKGAAGALVDGREGVVDAGRARGAGLGAVLGRFDAGGGEI